MQIYLLLALHLFCSFLIFNSHLATPWQKASHISFLVPYGSSIKITRMLSSYLNLHEKNEILNCYSNYCS